MISYYLTLVALIAASYLVVSLAGKTSLTHKAAGDTKRATTYRRIRIGAWFAFALFTTMVLVYLLWEAANAFLP